MTESDMPRRLTFEEIAEITRARYPDARVEYHASAGMPGTRPGPLVEIRIPRLRLLIHHDTRGRLTVEALQPCPGGLYGGQHCYPPLDEPEFSTWLWEVMEQFGAKAIATGQTAADTEKGC